MDASRLIAAGEAAPSAPATAATDSRRTAETSTPLLGRYSPFGSSVATPTGVVWEAEDVTQGGRVRCKVVPQSVLPSATWIERAIRELKQLGKVTTPRLHKILDQGRSEGGELVVVQEAMDAPALDDIVRRSGPLSPPRALRLVQQVGEALIEAQKVGVIHRDVAPHNVFVADGDEVKVSDFALAQPVNDKVYGTPQFLSPEQAEGKVPDQRSNIYSLAALMFYAVTGEAPFAGDIPAQLQQHLTAAPPSASGRRPGLPEALDKVLQRALDKSPSKRHLTLKQLLTELEQACAGVVDTTPKAARGKREPAATMLGIPSPFTQGQQSTPSAKTAVMSTAAAEQIAKNPAEDPAVLAAKAKAAEAQRQAEAAKAAEAQRQAEAAKAAEAQRQAEAAKAAEAQRQAAAAAEAAQRAASDAATKRAEAEAAQKRAATEAAAQAEAKAQAQKLAAQQAEAEAAQKRAAAAAQAQEQAAKQAEAEAAQKRAAAEAVAQAQKPAAPTAPTAPAEPTKPSPAKPAAKPQGSADKGGQKGGFRETAWFKRGEIEEELARREAEAAAKNAGNDPLAPIGITGEHKAAKDDTGTDLSGEDVNRLSLRTGSTQAMATIKPPTGPAIKGDRMSEDDMLAEVDNSKKRLTIAAIAVGVVVLILVVFFALSGKKKTEAPAKVGWAPSLEAPGSGPHASTEACCFSS